MFQTFSEKYKFAYIMFTDQKKLEAIINFKQKNNRFMSCLKHVLHLKRNEVEYKGYLGSWKAYPDGKPINNYPKEYFDFFWKLLEEKVKLESRDVMGMAEGEFHEELKKRSREIGLDVYTD
jgi:hypothetical protein